MLVKSIAAAFVAGVAIAAPAPDSEISTGTSLYSRQDEYKPCIINQPKCCPNNFIGFTLRGFPTLKCEDRKSSKQIRPKALNLPLTCLQLLR